VSIAAGHGSAVIIRALADWRAAFVEGRRLVSAEKAQAIRIALEVAGVMFGTALRTAPMPYSLLKLADVYA
jgi:hypothetical protein